MYRIVFFQTKQVAGALIKIINKKTERVRDKCAKLKLSMVLHAQQMVPNQKVTNNIIISYIDV